MPNRRERLAAALLVAPLLLFLLGVFLLPIGAFLWRAVAETDVAPALPRTLAALRDWSGRDLPGEAAFEALAADLRAARAADQAAGGGLIPRAAARLNAEIPGFRSTLPATARRLSSPEAPARETILAASPDWSKPESWAAIRRTGGPVSDLNLLAALDLRRDAAGGIAAVPPDQAVFRGVLLRTLWIALLATALSLLLGYPLAYLIATAPPRLALWMLGAVTLPLWISDVPRIAAWIVLLQRDGVANTLLTATGLLREPASFLFTRGTVLLATVNLLLPYAVLPIYASLRALDWRLPRAGLSLGASPWRVFRRVTLPLSMPGVGAGALLVFIQALGFYVTPALLGGPNDQMLSYFIGFYANRTVNWGLAAALSVVLLLAVAIVVALYARLVGFNKVRPA
ncbi:ABC transporter permease protein [Roseomonas mucosa]|uniref:Polyamine ABC transporter substrate-binding protein n=1 Tax=Roseomonas mucosa TaxID=207340 RepID=A0A1S8D9V5_9PROT|nr:MULTISPECIES: ABC transporter permease [Roseomonas]ATR21047.1 ABC transporter permease [Roseomonas sp. FDAARGOS_362]MCG7350131.1 ABC transporter permease [Roseomonas mucosa]MCG7355090.1 ABC transporter permease [Roseomonas mucosa]MDT8289769.1 ABC transporter permease [Roseomonas mucosa]MDT8292570.1 ABC transporter permease [Roseomonas mucosa]